MSEPDKKRQKLQNTHNVNSGPGPPPVVVVQCKTPSAQENSINIQKSAEVLNKYVYSRCLCEWQAGGYHQALLNSGSLGASKCSDDALIFCSSIQLLCETIARQSLYSDEQEFCKTLQQIQRNLFHSDTFNDFTTLLQQFLRSSNCHLSFAASKAISAWLKAAHEESCLIFLDNLLENIVSPLATSLSTLNSSGLPYPLPHTLANLLDLLRNCIDAPDIDSHPTEDDFDRGKEDSIPAGTSDTQVFSCLGPSGSHVTIPTDDAAGFHSKDLKGSVIRALGKHWNVIVTYFHASLTLAQSATSLHSEDIFPLVSFLSLWQSTISVKANISVLDAKPFYSRMEALLSVMTPSLDPIIWREIVSLFNEVLCYGSTLALQDFLPDEPCNLAHLVIRHVRVEKLLERAPIRQAQMTASDRSLIQKMVLMILKAIAVTVKETRSESSSLESETNSESGYPEALRSEDSEDLHADMTVILRSIKQVLRIVDSRIKSWLPFHPETAFSEWMIKVFNDQDDALVETMLCSLDINSGLYSNCRGLSTTSNLLQTGLLDLKGTLNPFQIWLRFLETVSYDTDVLLDFLVSNETCFLLYLLRLLKFIRRFWEDFTSSLTHRQLEDVMTCFIRLRIAIRRLVSKNLFPYNITPITKLLEKCEDLYEGKEN